MSKSSFLTRVENGEPRAEVFATTDPQVQQVRLLGRILATILIWTAAAALAVWSIEAIQPPKAVSSSANLQLFSAERAVNYIRAIARVPHPIGSPANIAVRDYLMQQLSYLGLYPTLFTATGIHTSKRAIVFGRTEDIVGRLPGYANSRAILLLAHYDSTANTPGAADDGSGVATILETVRALRASTKLKNDLIILFTDGEEPGLLGAEAFMTGHPWVKDIGLIINFDARGDEGPALLFETSANNGRLVRAVQYAAPYTEGSSLFYDIYKTLPNDTDLTVFRPLRIPSLNFAFGARGETYHSSLDSPQNLSAASVQQDGSYALSLAHYFGQVNLRSLQGSTSGVVFFDAFGKNLIVYSELWSIIGEGAATILFAIILVSRSSLINA